MFEVLTVTEAAQLDTMLRQGYVYSRIASKEISENKLMRNDQDLWRLASARLYDMAAVRQELTMLRTLIQRERPIGAATY